MAAVASIVHTSVSCLIFPAPKVTRPVPLGLILRSIFASLLPVADIVGPLLAAALAIVISLTALPVAVKRASSFPPVSKIEVPIAGEVKVLFVKVSVPVRVTSPSPVPNPQSIISGLVPSLAVA